MMKKQSNNCPCLLCHIGRNAGFLDGDFAPKQAVIDLINGFEATKAAFAVSDDEKKLIIAYIEAHCTDSMMHFEILENYYWDKYAEG